MPRPRTRSLGVASPTVAERFWSKVDRRGPDECWPWTRHLDKKGYGRIGIGKTTDGRQFNEVHSRVAWWLANGYHPGTLDVRHRCDNPPCCNPAHLEIGTHTDNMHDMHERGRAVQVRGEQIAQSALTEEEVREIVEMRNNGGTLMDIAARYNVHFGTVQHILLGKTWAHVTGLPRINRLAPVPRRNANAQGSNNNRAKLTEDDVRGIFAMSAEGKTQPEIAEVYGVRSNTVSRILSGKRWSHVQVGTG